MDQLRAAVGRLRPGGAPGRASLVAALVVALLLGAASEIRSGRGAARLADTFESPGAVAAAVLDALAAGDVNGLRRLALTADEFREVIWPELPSSRPEVALPVAYAWGTLAQNSHGSLASTLRVHGGRRYALGGVHVEGEVTDYATFTVHREVALDVTDAMGDRRRLRLFGSLVEQDHRWKIFSFVVD